VQCPKSNGNHASDTSSALAQDAFSFWNNVSQSQQQGVLLSPEYSKLTNKAKTGNSVTTAQTKNDIKGAPNDNTAKDAEKTD